MESLSLEKKIIIGLACIFVVISLYIFVRGKMNNNIEVTGNLETEEIQKRQVEESTIESIGDPSEKVESETVEIEPQKIYVYVCGCVKKPGVVMLSAGARMSDAVDLVGGLTADADLNSINMAEILSDEQKIYIPDKKEGQQINMQVGNSTSTQTKSTSGSLVNINTATLSQLDTIPGIGASTAQKIIDYRNMIGSFKKVDDIKNVSGIGEKKFENIRKYITI